MARVRQKKFKSSPSGKPHGEGSVGVSSNRVWEGEAHDFCQTGVVRLRSRNGVLRD